MNLNSSCLLLVGLNLVILLLHFMVTSSFCFSSFDRLISMFGLNIIMLVFLSTALKYLTSK